MGKPRCPQPWAWARFSTPFFEGRHWFFDPLGRVRVEVVSARAPWLFHDKLDVIIKSGALEGLAEVVDLKDYQRALVWVDGRFSHVLPPGLYAYWTTCREVKIEVVPSEDGVTICAVYPSDGRRENACEPGEHDHTSTRNNDVRVDFTVRVPEAAKPIGVPG